VARDPGTKLQHIGAVLVADLVEPLAVLEPVGRPFTKLLSDHSRTLLIDRSISRRFRPMTFAMERIEG
ncbi:MAG: hypothetical protein VXW58_11805, partial [Pseudomonadota bacterium]|nr:hypothetical protein [Pseudomonadota bacterium]